MGSLPIKISASRGAAILGLSAWTTQVEVWQNIIEEVYPGYSKENGYTLPEFKVNAPIRWGNAFEEAIIKVAEKKRKYSIHNREKLYIKDDFISCHIDGRYLDRPLHEGKTTAIYTYNEKWGEPGTDMIPREYAVQVQHQMICTGAKSCIVSVLVFPRRVEDWENMGIAPEGDFSKLDTYKWARMLDEMGFFHQYEVQASKELHKLMIEKYKTWWQDYIVEKKIPPQMSYDDIRRLVNQPSGTIIATDEIERLSKEYKDIGKELGKTGNLEKRRTQLKVKITDWMRKNEDFIVDDDSTDKWITRSGDGGKKLFSFDGNTLR